MKKKRQRNWLLVITGLLFVSSVVAFIISARGRISVGACYYEGKEYRQNDILPNYDGRKDCYCSWNSEIVCEETDVNMQYESFTSSGMNFTYSFKNFLDNSKPDLGKFVVRDITQQSGLIEISLERETYCSSEGLVPTQTALYKRESSSLVLTNITNRDESVYNRTCLIGNVFSISNWDISQEKSFSLLYQNEYGQLYDLNICFLNGKMYTERDVFKDNMRNMLCTCEGPEINCEQL